MSKNNHKSGKSSAAEPDHESDWVWGAENIAREINRTKAQVYPLLPKLLEAGVVKRFGHRSYAASRAGLRRLISV